MFLILRFLRHFYSCQKRTLQRHRLPDNNVSIIISVVYICCLWSMLAVIWVLQVIAKNLIYIHSTSTGLNDLSVSTKLLIMKSRSKLYYLFSCAFLLIKYCDGETMKEKQNREKYCGLAPDKWKSFQFPWYVGLRVTIGSEKFYYTGTLISNK